MKCNYPLELLPPESVKLVISRLYINNTQDILRALVVVVTVGYSILPVGYLLVIDYHWRMIIVDLKDHSYTFSHDYYVWNFLEIHSTVIFHIKDTSILSVCDLFATYSDWLILTYDGDYKRFYCQNDRVFCGFWWECIRIGFILTYHDEHMRLTTITGSMV